MHPRIFPAWGMDRTRSITVCSKLLVARLCGDQSIATTEADVVNASPALCGD